MSDKIYQIVTQKIVDQLKKGVIPWKKSWKSGGAPVNLVSKKAYRGINVWLLALAGYASPYWVSYKQCAELGGQVKKGEKATLVIFWKILKKEEKNAKGELRVKGIPMLRYYNVFNSEQCEGLKVPEAGPALEFSPNELCEAVVDGYCDKPEIFEKENRAYYMPALDLVNMPKKEDFKSVDGYYATLFHELVHSSGHADRLNREGIINKESFGSHGYSKEELVAEFGAAYLAALCGIESTTDNSVAYIQNWMEALAGNEKWLVLAATKAQQAVDYMLGVYYNDGAPKDEAVVENEVKEEVAA